MLARICDGSVKPPDREERCIAPSTCEDNKFVFPGPTPALTATWRISGSHDRCRCRSLTPHHMACAVLVGQAVALCVSATHPHDRRSWAASKRRSGSGHEECGERHGATQDVSASRRFRHAREADGPGPPRGGAYELRATKSVTRGGRHSAVW